jgi:hypothetical protein
MTACTPKEEEEWKARLSSAAKENEVQKDPTLYSSLSLNIKSLGTVFGKPGKTTSPGPEPSMICADIHSGRHLGAKNIDPPSDHSRAKVAALPSHPQEHEHPERYFGHIFELCHQPISVAPHDEQPDPRPRAITRGASQAGGPAVGRVEPRDTALPRHDQPVAERAHCPGVGVVYDTQVERCQHYKLLRKAVW